VVEPGGDPAAENGTDSRRREQDIDINTSTPSIARAYDYLLGGKDNFAVDRAASEELKAAAPEITLLAEANRAFIRQVVRYLVGTAGIRQIIDIGSGLPTAGNVHEIAQEIAPETRVVYVDNDPIVLAHGRALLATNENTTMMTADLRWPDEIFDSPRTRRLIDTGEPFAVLLGGILMHLDDEEDPEGTAASIRDRLPSGGYLMISNTCDTGEPRARTPPRLRRQQHGQPLLPHVAGADPLLRRARPRRTRTRRQQPVAAGPGHARPQQPGARAAHRRPRPQTLTSGRRRPPGPPDPRPAKRWPGLSSRSPRVSSRRLLLTAVGRSPPVDSCGELGAEATSTGPGRSSTGPAFARREPDSTQSTEAKPGRNGTS
jgi:hypothetical protein